MHIQNEVWPFLKHLISTKANGPLWNAALHSENFTAKVQSVLLIIMVKSQSTLLSELSSVTWLISEEYRKHLKLHYFYRTILKLQIFIAE